MIDALIVQPIFNLLVFIYDVIPGGDFGLSIILFTIIVRVSLWPLVKKQLHSTKALKAIQPDIKKIREKFKGNKQKEAEQLMELYKERGISPLGSIGVMFLQLPILLALFAGIRAFERPTRLVELPYEFLVTNQRTDEILSNVAQKTDDAINQLDDQGLQSELREIFGEQVEVAELRALPKTDLVKLYEEQLVVTDDSGSTSEMVQPPFFHPTLFGAVDLSKRAFDTGAIYWPLMAMAVLAGGLQYFQARQLSPDEGKRRRLKDILKESAEGKQVEQADINAAMGRNMRTIFPLMTGFFAATFPGALSLYWVTGSIIALAQNRLVLSRDVEEMEDMPMKVDSKKTVEPAPAEEAEPKKAKVTAEPKKKASGKKKSRNQRKKKEG
jgi:YidC/Oxa1 family membrane protein insertase